jgi:hypothetical protein
METLHGRLNWHWQHFRVFRYRTDGSQFIMEWKIAPIRSEKNVITRYPATQREAK